MNDSVSRARTARRKGLARFAPREAQLPWAFRRPSAPDEQERPPARNWLYLEFSLREPKPQTRRKFRS